MTTYAHDNMSIFTVINIVVDHINMWQSRVEIEGYSVAYFDRIAAFKAPYC